MGSYDIRVADRCVELFRAGRVRLVCFSGASGNFTEGLFPRGEAHAFADRARELGLPEEALIIEPAARNTADNIRLARPLLEARGVRSIILVAKPNMLARGRATLPIHWPGLRADFAAARVPFAGDLAPGRTIRDLIEELVGDAERLRVYPERGWQVRVSIPAEVAEAVRELIRRGYGGHLPK